MEQYLMLWWNWAIFIGEISSSLLFISLGLIAWTLVKQKFYLPLILSSVGLLAIIVGQGLSNIIQSGNMINFTFLVNLLLTCCFLAKYNLIPMVIGAQILGSIIGYGCYWWCKQTFKAFKIEMTLRPWATNKWKPFLSKEILAQFLLVITLLSISFMDYNSGLLVSLADLKLKLIIMLIAVLTLLILFAHVSYFMFAPWLSLIYLLLTKPQEIQGWINYSLAISIQTSFALSFAFILREIKW